MSLERGRSDSDDRARTVSDPQRPTDGVGTLPEAADPQPIADDGGTTVARRSSRKLVVLLNEKPAHGRRDSEHGEVTAGDEAGAQVAWRRFVVESHFQIRRVVGGEHARQRRLAIAQLLIDRIEHDEALAATLRLK